MKPSAKVLRAWKSSLEAAYSGGAPDLATLVESVGWVRGDSVATKRELASKDRRLAAAAKRAADILPPEWRGPLLSALAKEVEAEDSGSDHGE